MKYRIVRGWPHSAAAALLLSLPTLILVAGASPAAQTADLAQPADGSGSREPASTQAAADAAPAPVAFVICDERSGETGRVVKVEWVGRIDERTRRCD
jgi:hypothetical protein